MTILAGVLGVLSGSLLAQKLRLRYPTADAFICGLGLLCSAPLFYGALVLAVGPLAPVYVLFFIAMWCLCLNWALVGDILLVSHILCRAPCLVFSSQYLFNVNYTLLFQLHQFFIRFLLRNPWYDGSMPRL